MGQDSCVSRYFNNFYKKYEFVNESFKLVCEILGNLGLFQNKDDQIISMLP